MDLYDLVTKALNKYENGEEKGKIDTVDPNLKNLYDGMPALTKMQIFGNDIKNAQWVLFNIRDLLDEDGLSDLFSDEENLEKAWDLFVSIWSRIFIMQPSELVESISNKWATAGIEDDILLSCIAESLGYIYAMNPKQKARGMSYLFREQMVRKIAGGNLDIEDRDVDDPEYGLVPSKPVFVCGFLQQRIYMDSLCASDGREITYSRRGSMQVEGISGPVDIYDLFYENGEKYLTIFVCLYGKKNSQTAPGGLKFRE